MFNFISLIWLQTKILTLHKIRVQFDLYLDLPAYGSCLWGCWSLPLVERELPWWCCPVCWVGSQASHAGLTALSGSTMTALRCNDIYDQPLLHLRTSPKKDQWSLQSKHSTVCSFRLFWCDLLSFFNLETVLPLSPHTVFIYLQIRSYLSELIKLANEKCSFQHHFRHFLPE